MTLLNWRILCPFLFAALLPISANAASWAALAWILAYLVASIREKALPTFSVHHPTFILLVLPVLFWAWHIVGLLYTTDPATSGWDNVELKASILLLPLLAFLLPNVGKSDTSDAAQMPYIYTGFIVGCFSAVVICVGSAFFYLPTDGALSFFYLRLVRPLDAHPTYLGMYVVFALFATLELPAHWWLFRGRGWVRGVVATIFAVFVVLLVSRGALLAMAIIGVCYALYRGYAAGKLWRGVMNAVVGVAALVLILRAVPEFQSRTVRIQTAAQTANAENLNADSRVQAWHGAIQVIREHPIWGVGTGDAYTELVNAYHQQGSAKAEHDHLNAHNQFLQTYVQLGIIGFVLLLTMLGTAFYRALRTRNVLFVIFIALFCIINIFEATFERQAGVLFFSFFLALLSTAQHQFSSPSYPQQRA